MILELRDLNGGMLGGLEGLEAQLEGLVKDECSKCTTERIFWTLWEAIVARGTLGRVKLLNPDTFF